jgi:hypothetical protein
MDEADSAARGQELGLHDGRLGHDLEHRRTCADHLTWMPDDRGGHASFRRVDLDRTTRFTVRQLLVHVENLALQCVDLVGCRDRDSCELVLRIVHFTNQPELGALELLQLGLRLHPGLLARLHFIQ